MKNVNTIVPSSVRYDTRLAPNAKLLYSELIFMCKQNNNKCLIQQGNVAKLYSVTSKSIFNWIRQLEECGYISKRERAHGIEIKISDKLNHNFEEREWCC